MPTVFMSVRNATISSGFRDCAKATSILLCNVTLASFLGGVFIGFCICLLVSESNTSKFRFLCRYGTVRDIVFSEASQLASNLKSFNWLANHTRSQFSFLLYGPISPGYFRALTIMANSIIPKIMTSCGVNEIHLCKNNC